MRRRGDLTDLLRRSLEQAPPNDDRDWLVALEVACDVQDLEVAFEMVERER